MNGFKSAADILQPLDLSNTAVKLLRICDLCNGLAACFQVARPRLSELKVEHNHSVKLIVIKFKIRDKST